jgi:uncharacterized protein (TIGR00730 family)
MNYHSVCVFCGAQNSVPAEHLELALTFGRDLAKNNRKLVYGGGDCGLMGKVANGALLGGGEVIGVFPRSLSRIEVEHQGLSKMYLVDSMHERKQIMYDHADVFVVLPGGFGTLDEMFEVITWRQIGVHKKPVVILNHHGYWDKLEELMEHMIEVGFAKPITREFYEFVNTPEELYALLQMKA